MIALLEDMLELVVLVEAEEAEGFGIVKVHWTLELSAASSSTMIVTAESDIFVFSLVVIN